MKYGQKQPQPKSFKSDDPNVIINKYGAMKRNVEVVNHSQAETLGEVFKLQLPVVTTDKIIMCLAYNKSRSWQGQFPLTPSVQGLFADRKKVYVKCLPDKEGQLHLLHIVPDEDW